MKKKKISIDDGDVIIYSKTPTLDNMKVKPYTAEELDIIERCRKMKVRRNRINALIIKIPKITKSIIGILTFIIILLTFLLTVVYKK